VLSTFRLSAGSHRASARTSTGGHPLTVEGATDPHLPVACQRGVIAPLVDRSGPADRRPVHGRFPVLILLCRGEPPVDGRLVAHPSTIDSRNSGNMAVLRAPG